MARKVEVKEMSKYFLFEEDESNLDNTHYKSLCKCYLQPEDLFTSCF